MPECIFKHIVAGFTEVISVVNDIKQKDFIKAIEQATQAVQEFMKIKSC